jgi:hypothetical protein
MLRASGNVRIVAMSYLAGGCLATVSLVAVVALTPTGEAVREVLTAPFVRLAERGRPPARVVDVASTGVLTLRVQVLPAVDDVLGVAATPVNVGVPLAALPSVEASVGVASPPPEIAPSVEFRVVPALEPSVAQAEAPSAAAMPVPVAVERVSEVEEQQSLVAQGSPPQVRPPLRVVATAVAVAVVAEPPVLPAEVVLPTAPVLPAEVVLPTATPSLPAPAAAPVIPTATVSAPAAVVPPIDVPVVSTVVAMATSAPMNGMPVATQVMGAAPTATPAIPTMVPAAPTTTPVIPTGVPVLPTAILAIPVAPTRVSAVPTAILVVPTRAPVIPTAIHAPLTALPHP